MQYLPSREAAKILGLHPHTLRRYADTGIIPYIKTQSGQRRYDVQTYLGNSKPMDTTICYCRCLQPQADRRPPTPGRFACRQQYPNAEDHHRRRIRTQLPFCKGLATILERIHQGDKLTLVVAYRDRLARFGTELIEQMLEQNGGELLVLNQRDLSPPEELHAQDLLAILTLFSARANGLRRYRKKIQEDKNLPKTGNRKPRLNSGDRRRPVRLQPNHRIPQRTDGCSQSLLADAGQKGHPRQTACMDQAHSLRGEKQRSAGMLAEALSAVKKFNRQLKLDKDKGIRLQEDYAEVHFRSRKNPGQTIFIHASALEAPDPISHGSWDL